jgi:ribosomal protein L11 methyltransferase
MAPSGETTNRMLTDIHTICQKVLDAVFVSKTKLTPRELGMTLSQRFGIEKKALKNAIRYLVAHRKLTYTYHFGCSFLEQSFNTPTRISERTVLKPSGTLYQPEPNDVVVELKHGASFGTGEHPTTRLAIRGVEKALSKKNFFRDKNDILALDLGTGSGVLAIVAVLLGVKAAIGIDIDPCAIAEAKENVQLNDLENKIQILDMPLKSIDKQFSLIIANLRYPTLKRLCSHIAGITEKEGAAVVSGIKKSEVSDLLNSFTRQYFKCFWQEFEKDWAGLAFVRC